MFIKLKAKDVKPIIDATFPTYKKHNVYICPSEKITLSGLNWSGGSRSEYRACTVDGKPLKLKVDMHSPAPWNNQFEGKDIEIPKDMIVVKGGTFCGKTGILFIHVHPDNMPKYLPFEVK